MGHKKVSPLIRQFQRAVKKLKALVHNWRLHSRISTRGSRQIRWCELSNNHQMGFHSFLDDDDDVEQVNNNDNMDHIVQHRRTMGYGSEDDSIDERAEIFIANFRRQLSLERRVYYSEPQCCIRDSFEGD